MKPRIFIGSSLEGKAIAEAIHVQLQRDGECTVWTAGVFQLSQSNLQNLMFQVADSDFGIFVFSPDDLAEIRGKLFRVARDNVVYELGLFSGALGPERCFFLVPMDVDIHLPSDLLGMQPGSYEVNRSDKSWEAAVAPFCTQIRKQVVRLGLRSNVDQGLLELITNTNVAIGSAPRVRAI
jgi:predicted nucleotide-binding protein